MDQVSASRWYPGVLEGSRRRSNPSASGVRLTRLYSIVLNDCIPQKTSHTFFSAAFLVVLVLVSTLAAPMLKLCFGTGKEVPLRSGTTTILSTLVKGSAAEVKKVISRQGVKAAITQLQKLELPREERRRRNRLFVRCLADTQGKAFSRLKKFPNKE